MQHALTHALDQWRHGVWLLEAGSDRFTLYPDETALLGATILSDSETPPQTEIRFTLLRQEQVAFQHTAIVPLDQRGAATISLPIPPLPMGEYQVQAQLIVAQRVVDEVHHTLTVAARPQLADASPIRVEDGQFVEQGAGGARRWFAFGVNFWPRYVAGMEEADYWRFWLDPSNYDPELVEQDLRLVKALGMNCVSVQYLKVRQALPLRDFLHRCQAHGIRVNLYVDGLHPLYFQPELAQELMQAASLASQPTLFAYDLAWEPIWGDYTQRRAHESAWRVWRPATGCAAARERGGRRDGCYADSAPCGTLRRHHAGADYSYAPSDRRACALHRAAGLERRRVRRASTLRDPTSSKAITAPRKWSSRLRRQACRYPITRL